MGEYVPADRRPLRSRQATFSNVAAAKLAALHISPNAISIAGMCCAITAGALAASTRAPGWWDRPASLLVALLAQARLMANLLDGMVAMLRHSASATGELYNELPDRVSDAAILIGAGYAAGGSPIAGFIAALLAVSTAYVRAVGNAAGVRNLFLGPMAKQHRMFLITVASVYLALTPVALHGRLLSIMLWIIAAGCIVTIGRRVSRIAAGLRDKSVQ